MPPMAASSMIKLRRDLLFSRHQILYSSVTRNLAGNCFFHQNNGENSLCHFTPRNIIFSHDLYFGFFVAVLFFSCPQTSLGWEIPKMPGTGYWKQNKISSRREKNMFSFSRVSFATRSMNISWLCSKGREERNMMLGFLQSLWTALSERNSPAWNTTGLLQQRLLKMKYWENVIRCAGLDPFQRALQRTKPTFIFIGMQGMEKTNLCGSSAQNKKSN